MGCSWSPIWLGTYSVYCLGTLSEQGPWFCGVRASVFLGKAVKAQRGADLPHTMYQSWTVSFVDDLPSQGLKNASRGGSHPIFYAHWMGQLRE